MYESVRYPTPRYAQYQSPGTAYAPNYAYPPTPYPYPMGFPGPQNYGSYVSATPRMPFSQEPVWQWPSPGGPVVQMQMGYPGHGLLNNDMRTQGQVHPTQTGAGASAQGLQVPHEMICQDAAASESLAKMTQRNVPQASRPLSVDGTVRQDGSIHTSRDDSQATLAKTVPVSATVPTAPEANLVSWEEVTVPVEDPQGQKLVPTGESCQNLYTGPQMILADAVQEVSAGAGTPGVRSSVDQVLSDECKRTGTELATGAVAPMDLPVREWWDQVALVQARLWGSLCQRLLSVLTHWCLGQGLLNSQWQEMIWK